MMPGSAGRESNNIASEQRLKAAEYWHCTALWLYPRGVLDSVGDGLDPQNHPE